MTKKLMTERGVASTLRVPVEVYGERESLLTLDEHEDVRIGRLFQIRLKKNAAARKAAHDSIRQLPNLRWQARVGGLIRGFAVVRTRKADVERFVDDYYNRQIHEWVSTTEKARRSE